MAASRTNGIGYASIQNLVGLGTPVSRTNGAAYAGRLRESWDAGEPAQK